jgi:hypothetical protein
VRLVSNPSDDSATITTVAGDGPQSNGVGDYNGNGVFSGDGGPATAAHFVTPLAVATDPRGDVVIADAFSGRVRALVPVTPPADTPEAPLLPLLPLSAAAAAVAIARLRRRAQKETTTCRACSGHP